ncbi:MAG: SGNH/GDSL hydrolase family protein [Clostridia bacterium]|nr:SGNH/GDSL hydrolase family protein [Clostridia bacterium]
MKAKTIAKILITAGICIGTLALATEVLMPKYRTSLQEGSLIAEYYKETAAHDVLFAGDCEFYENIVPDVLWQEYGISSYIRGSAQQLIPQTYCLTAEMLEKEKPALVAVSVLAMSEPTQTNEAYNRMSIDGMKLSKYKLESIKATKMEEETLASYLFPILRYHDRWKELTAEDFSGLFKDEIVSDSGYMMNLGIKPAENVPGGKPLADYRFAAVNMEYLQKIADLCKEKDVPLLLIKSPSLYPFWYGQWSEQLEAFAEANGIVYINTLDHLEEIGLDFAVDTYDSGLHLNLAGGEKLTKWLGGIISEEYNLTDHRGDEAYEKVWTEKHKAFEARKEELKAQQ